MLTPGDDHSQVSCMVAINLIERGRDVQDCQVYIAFDLL